MEALHDHLRIRKIRMEDAPEISAIQAAITKTPVVIDFRHIIEEQVPQNAEVSFVAELNGAVVGYMISYVVFGGFGLEKTAWIATLGVHPKYMGEGIGHALAEKILHVYREMGIANIFTSVQWDSVDLLSFFKTLGFDRSHFINLRKKLAL